MEKQVITTVQIAGMHCPACQKVIEKKLAKIAEVLEVKVLLSGEVIIVADRLINVDEIKLALEGTDYIVS